MQTFWEFCVLFGNISQFLEISHNFRSRLSDVSDNSLILSLKSDIGPTNQTICVRSRIFNRHREFPNETENYADIELRRKTPTFSNNAEQKLWQFSENAQNFKKDAEFAKMYKNPYFSYEDMTLGVHFAYMSLWVYAHKCQNRTSVSWNIIRWEVIFHLPRKVGILVLCAFACSTKFILYPHGSKVQKRNLGSPVQCSTLNYNNHPSLNPFQIILLQHSAISPKPLPFPRPLPGRQPPARCAARQRLLATACRRRPASAASSGVSDLDGRPRLGCSGHNRELLELWNFTRT